MNQLKLAIAAIFLFNSASVFGQSRGGVVSTPTTSSPTPTTQYVQPSTGDGTASYGTTPATTATVAPSINAQATTTPTDTSSTGAYTPIVSSTDTSGIQTSGKSSSGNNKIGIVLGIGATVFSTYNATVCCASENTACALGLSCPMWIAGVVASVVVTGYMSMAKSKSDGTVAGVTDPTATSATGASGTSTTGTDAATQAAAYNQDPAWQNVQQNLDTLKSSGWSVDPTTGVATNTKTGQTISPSDLSSPAAMSAAGYSASDIKAFDNMMDQAMAAGKKLAATRAADASGNVFDGVTGGGKSGSSVMNAALAGAALRTANRQAGLGINRDPAQVAGMAKSYNGEQIGVAQDSLFNMIDRRYQLHDKNGSFISP